MNEKMDTTINPIHAPRYGGIPTFMRTPLVTDLSEIDIALVGVPYDGAVEVSPGARHGPREIRNKSTMMRSIHHVTRVNPYDLCKIGDIGDVPIPRVFEVVEALADISLFYEKIYSAGVVPLSVGGDHSITLPILRALKPNVPLSLIHFDAHTDTYDEELGYKYTHGTPFRRAVEEGLIDPSRSVQVGIRGAANSEEGWNFSINSGMRVIFMEEFTKLGVEEVVKEIRNIVGETPTYLSYDIDSIDPAFAPGTGTPEIGGLTTLEAQSLIRGLRGVNLIGADVVEVAPGLDPSGVTSLVGATIMYEILCILSESVVK
ncbi:MAG: agmatinase [Candidatus Heimdallarchaeota archaeon]|nr:agmatinase [Candidatus Heimdallarchaeota archaeon]MCK5047961.1 agmatinase [Candidatus Heimdallarchaeota archaeon]